MCVHRASGPRSCVGGRGERLTRFGILNLSHVHEVASSLESSQTTQTELLKSHSREPSSRDTSAQPPPGRGPWHTVGPQEVSLGGIKGTKALSSASSYQQIPGHHGSTNPDTKLIVTKRETSEKTLSPLGDSCVSPRHKGFCRWGPNRNAWYSGQGRIQKGPARRQSLGTIQPHISHVSLG